MTQNPFETPQANPYAQPAPDIQGTGTFDIGQAVGDGWNIMNANAGTLIGAFFVFGVVAFFATITIIGAFLVVPVLFWGFVRLVLNAVDDTPELGDIFEGFKNYGQALISMFVWYLIIFLIGLPGQALTQAGVFTENYALMGLGYLFGIGVGLFVTIRLYFAPYFYVDQGLGVMEGIKASWEATKPQKLMNFLLILVTSIIAFAGIIAFGIGMIYTLPLGSVIYAVAYRQMVPRT